jgi:hypothetical protein
MVFRGIYKGLETFHPYKAICMMWISAPFGYRQARLWPGNHWRKWNSGKNFFAIPG